MGWSPNNPVLRLDGDVAVDIVPDVIVDVLLHGRRDLEAGEMSRYTAFQGLPTCF
jgi:hypothetical protein